jgi:hypothetical protein
LTLSSLSPIQSLPNLEKWLIEFDPSFTEPITSFPLQQLIRIKQTHSLQFQLHPHHSLLLTVHQVYLKLLVSGHPDGARTSLKSLQRYQRIYDFIKAVCPEFTFERIEFEKVYFEKLNDILNHQIANSGAKKVLQVQCGGATHLIYCDRDTESNCKRSDTCLMSSGTARILDSHPTVPLLIALFVQTSYYSP